ncbi:hypothetical protein P3U10_13025 [Mammaliicoccus sciuri]|uniref:hypothetical protein n=1 Tax=Mammaliicoccus sciuri TaxID=1296 RepID=UPI002B2589EB|nr:hypothetical protein [Mammaliicoccus sciuri]WQK60404.1 hypothetical protein P3U10_13025 [Mammaliicoccus sciuri]
MLIEGAVTLRRVFNYLSMAIVMILILSGCQNGSQEETKQHSETKHAETKQIKLSEQDRDTLKQELLKIADEYGQDQHKAVSNRYFSRNEQMEGDGYAISDDGEIQITDHDKPGRKHFNIHNVVGLTMYQSKHNQGGYDERAQDLTNIQGYSSVAKMDQPITKYLFADNGKVYEYQFKSNSEPSLSTGFATKDYNGKDPNLKPNEKFTVSKDKILNKKWKMLLSEYK